MFKPKRFSYEGKDLETMSLAQNYHQWILALFKPYLGKKLVEVGAGSGSFSLMLAGLHPKSLVLVEPSKEMYPLLLEQAKILKKETKMDVKTYNDFFANVSRTVKKSNNSNAIIYVNVLEHVPDDQAELQAVYETLPKGGRVFIFVPALPGLMSDFDKKIGHFRRYTKKDLAQKATSAGFKIIKLHYFDFFGILPWWLKFTKMRSTTMGSGATRLYDNVVVPIASRMEKVMTPPIGKNVLLIAEKTKN